MVNTFLNFKSNRGTSYFVLFQLNISVYDPNENPDASPDNWHWDSLAYTGVVALHDVQEMEGGEIEVKSDSDNFATRFSDFVLSYRRKALLLSSSFSTPRRSWVRIPLRPKSQNSFFLAFSRPR